MGTDIFYPLLFTLMVFYVIGAYKISMRQFNSRLCPYDQGRYFIYNQQSSLGWNLKILDELTCRDEWINDHDPEFVSGARHAIGECIESYENITCLDRAVWQHINEKTEKVS